MRKCNLALILGTVGALTLAGCGGGGGGGGGGPSKASTKLYLFGTMSSNYNIASVDTSVIVPNFKDYTAPTGSTATVFQLRSGVLVPSAKVSLATASYDTVGKVLTINVSMDRFKNMSSSTTSNAGKGTEFATLITTPGSTFPSADASPYVGQFWLNGPNVRTLTGCKVNYAP
ncbi:hypothetical protein [Geobacter argillaceus]|uniref:Lipoprotein n=1 Tax=Geobacter argillaceus TaxID=345631 RepID=A0A562WSM0_9BACT|nr:hypothetical protein [Geobacter argillaceus]TWJ33594.1 hypothetical protein JN12_00271 [Geobacter argillaceus]